MHRAKRQRAVGHAEGNGDVSVKANQCFIDEKEKLAGKEPGFRLTAGCIWRSFENSGKRHIVLTGNRGSGKTTLLGSMFEAALPGITTWAEPRKAVYLKENLTGTTVQVGVFDDSPTRKGNKMVLCQDGFVSLGVPAILRCMQAESEWVSIDEIGFLEADCEIYHDAIRRLMKQKQVIAVVRKQELPFLQELCSREDVFLVDLDRPFGKNGCVVMASGVGRRFGGNKLMADFKGDPLICSVLKAAKNMFAEQVVVTRHQEVAVLCGERGIRVVHHDMPNRNDTVRLGLEALDDIENCMFCQGDQPLLKKETIAALALAAQNGKEYIWRVAFEGEPGSPVVFPKWAFEELKTLPEGKGGGVLIKKYPERVRVVNVQDMYELMDVDSPEDLSRLAGQ